MSKFWPVEALGNLITISKGKKPGSVDSSQNEGYSPYLTASQLLGNQPKKWACDGIHARNNDVLISWDGTIGNVGWNLTGIVGSTVGIISPKNNKIIPAYLGYFLKSMKDLIQQTATGSTIKHVRKSTILDMELPLPPLKEQQRIVSILDETFARLAVSSNQLNQKILIASELYQTNLSLSFAENESWGRGCLGDITGGVQTGPFGSLLHKSDYIENGIPIVNPAHITESGIMPDDRKTISSDTANRLSNYTLKSRDVVIGRRGEMGRCAVVNEEQEGWLCGTGSFFIKPSEQIDSRFLVKLLWAARYRKKLNEVATGATMKNLNNKALSNLVIEFPSVSEQTEIVSRLDRMYSEVEMLKRTISLKMECLEELKQSMLQEAFRGNL